MAQKHYVDNKKLFEVMVKHRNLMIKYKKAQKKTKRKLKVPPIPEYIGECLLMIATRLSNKPNFANYTFREDMISDAIENCILYMHNFDPKKSQNPFAYYTAAITNSFTRILNIEKKNQNIRDDILEMNGLNPSWTRQNAGAKSAAEMSGPVISSTE